MKKFKVTVNGKSYEVEVEELGGTPAYAAPPIHTAPVAVSPAPKPLTVKPSPVPASVETATDKKEEPEPKKTVEKAVPEQKPVSTEPANAKPAEGSETISCPMPGTILSVNVKEGDTVKKRDVLFILEAMKMENEI
ncbi:MAG TPA: hypothetical protein DD426_11605, partial [Clostridiaceae bacterium]|nr:hypothetical protein [Clostridiaceae bacterium]